MTSTNPRPLPGQPSSISNPFVASEHAGDDKRHLLLASSGSVVTIKLPNILKELSRYNELSIRIALTKAAEKLFAGQSAEQPLFTSLYSGKNVDGIYRDEDERDKPWVRGRGVGVFFTLSYDVGQIFS
ncbi:hypothetical protein HO173_011415 [Letharia columbiana]|uniref:Uncharacterized protein n=1 Tax=Letharia columbiana TaxID=112416 RepID=A0A8H6KZ35_9LECA|nr:uncharacterized protein HO173_011415 [Letharia columbiana]KAF6229560.1 hypothetical protein HO173_011415 [Letharia columbiana]